MKFVIAGAATAALIPLALVMTLIVALADTACSPASGGLDVAHRGDVATTLLQVAHAVGANDKVTLALVEAGLVESDMRTGAAVRAKDHDSVGPLQQRPSQGWGTAAQLEDPVYAARAFLLGPARAGAADPNGEIGAIARGATHRGTAGQLAQAVQRSAKPLEYDRHEAEASALIATLTRRAVASDSHGSVRRSATGPSGLAWGGYSNGQIPLAAMTEIAPGQHLRPDAAVAWNALQALAETQLGHRLGITDSYRPLHGPYGQYATKARKGAWAATPGTSRHGWGMALDVRVSGGFDGDDYKWLFTNGPRYGWENPEWARDGEGIDEAWHWEFEPDGSIPAPSAAC